MIKYFIKATARKTLNSMLGKSAFQPFFERLHKLSILGMNYGIGGGISDSGEIYLLQYVANQLKSVDEKIIVFDVGANTGDYTSTVLQILADLKPDVWAFEPSFSPFKSLLQRFKSSADVKTYNFGLGSEESEVKLFTFKNNPYLNSVYERKLKHYGIQLDQIENIQLQTVDDICKREDIDQIHLLKIDVEGHELRVLEGAKNLIDSSKINFIQLEFGGCHIDSKTYFRDIFYYLNEKYRIYRLLKDGLRLIDKYEECLEVFMTVNFLAELK